MLHAVGVVCGRHSLHNRYTKCLLLNVLAIAEPQKSRTRPFRLLTMHVGAIELSKRTAAILSPKLPPSLMLALGQCKHRLAQLYFWHWHHVRVLRGYSVSDQDNYHSAS